MNSNNWLSFPLSPDSNMHFSLGAGAGAGLVNDDTTINSTPFQNQAAEAYVEWNLMNNQERSHCQVEDFLGVTKSDNQDNYQLMYNNCSNSISMVNDDVNEQQDNLHYSNITLSMGTNGKQLQQADETTSSSSTTTTAIVPRRTSDTFGQRTSIYRGVTRHRWTGRYEAHLWDNSCRREGQSRKGRQVYLGGYDKEEKAARAYDLAALKYWGTSTTTNFPMNNYEKELEEMKHMTRQEFVASIRRKSSGFSRGASMYRGVTRHHQHGRWQARIGRVAGNKDLYLGTFSSEEEAAEAYDIAAIKFRGINAVTNFEMKRYDVKAIIESNSLPIGGGAAKRLKEAQAIESASRNQLAQEQAQAQQMFLQYPLPHGLPSFDTQPLLSLHSNQNQDYYLQQQQSSCYSYGNYLHTNPALLHVGPSDPNLGILGSGSGHGDELDYDQTAGWSGDNHGAFTMWNH